MSILEIPVTQIDTMTQRASAKIVSLSDFLAGNIPLHKATIDKIRASNDKNEIDRLKSSLPACQFCVTNGRGVQGIRQKSDIMQIDIDAKHNPRIEDLKEAVRDIPFIKFAMHSASGKGVFCLVTIKDPQQYSAHFEALRLVMKQEHGITIDEVVSSPASLRFWSFDPEPIINEDADRWDYIPKRTIVRQDERFRVPTAVGSTIENYNAYGDVESLLTSHGWIYSPSNDSGSRRRYTRPGKRSGVSADFCLARRIFYVFSSAEETGLPLGRHGYKPATVLCYLKFNGDRNRTLAYLKSIGY